MASTNRDEISRLELLHAAHPDGLVFPHLADAYRRAGRYAQAESVLNAGLRRHADYSSAHVVLGRLRLDQGKRREAENSFQRVLQLDPHNHVALEFLGRLAADEGRPDDALGYLRRLATLQPSDELADQIALLERQAREIRESRDPEPTSLPPGNSPRDPGGGAASVGYSASGGSGDSAGSVGPAVSDGSGSGAGSNGGGDAAPSGDESRDAPLPELEPGEVVTETMAELYARQGLHDRAEAVYRQLHERDPSDGRLMDRLAEARARLQTDAGSEAPSRAPEAAGPAVDTSTASPAAEGIPPDSTGPGIRGYMAGLLAWEPDGSSGPLPETEFEPATAQEAEVGAAVADVHGSDSEASDAPDPPEMPDMPAASDEPDEPDEPDASDSHPPDPPVEPWASAPVSEAGSGSAFEPWADSPGSGQEPPASPAPAAAVDQVEREPPALGPDTVRTPAGPGTTAEDLGLTEDALEGANSQTRALIALTDLLVGLLEYRDPFFRGSSSLTRLLATTVAREMDLNQTDRVNLALAAVLRDLGRLALGGKLVESQEGGGRTPEDRRRIERHVDLALHLMEGIDLPRPVRLAVRHHHERWDGDGYPDGLAGEGIPRLARVLAAVDSFAAMVSPRPYRLPRKVPDAAQELEDAAGSQYDPEVVAALLRVLEYRDQPRMGFVQRHHILMVNPDHPGAVVTAAKLCSSGFLAEVAVDADAARERLRRVPIAALVVSAETGEEQAEELVRELRIDPLFASLPIVVVEAETVALRVRLLESGADVCFPPGISHGELQGTLGALVRRTLRTRETPADGGEAPWLALQGDIQDFPLAWLLQVMKYDSRTAGIGIRTASDQGAIYIQKGDVVHAQIRGGAKGEAALKSMLRWAKGRFTVQPDAEAKEQSIQTSTMHLLLTQAVEEDHAAAGVFGAVSDS